MSAVTKKKRVSKKNKKAWRKYCDTKDVDDFLEDQRQEERGGKIEKEKETLTFDTVDVKPSLAKQLKRARLSETPKCFQILLNSSKVQDPNAKRNHVNPVGSKPTALSKLIEKRRFEKGIYKKKIEMARKNRKIAVEKKKKSNKIRQTFDVDLWGNALPSSKSIPESLVDDFIPVEAQLHNLLPEQRLRAKPPPPKTLLTRAAVEAPHPGVSYNPSYQEHQELLHQVAQHEEKLMKKEAHLQRVTTKMFSRVSAQEKENQWREEMSAGIERPHDPAQEPEPDDNDNEYRAVNPPVRNKKKDHKTRRRQKEMLVEKEKAKREKIDKKKITDIYKLLKIQSSLTMREKRLRQERARRAERRARLEAEAPPALNRNKPAPREPDFVEPAQLTADLRTLRANSNLLRERYEALQHRGALPGARLMMNKKRKLKSYFKPGHKVTDRDVDRYLAANKKSQTEPPAAVKQNIKGEPAAAAVKLKIKSEPPEDVKREAVNDVKIKRKRKVKGQVAVKKELDD